MSLILNASSAVRRAIGPANLAVITGRLPLHVQCHGCGQYIDTALSGTVNLSVVLEQGISVTTFSHPACGESRLFTVDEYGALADQLGNAAHATPPTGEYSAVYIDGELRVIDDDTLDQRGDDAHTDADRG